MSSFLVIGERPPQANGHMYSNGLDRDVVPLKANTPESYVATSIRLRSRSSIFMVAKLENVSETA